MVQWLLLQKIKKMIDKKKLENLIENLDLSFHIFYKILLTGLFIFVILKYFIKIESNILLKKVLNLVSKIFIILLFGNIESYCDNGDNDDINTKKDQLKNIQKNNSFIEWLLSGLFAMLFGIIWSFVDSDIDIPKFSDKTGFEAFELPGNKNSLIINNNKVAVKPVPEPEPEIPDFVKKFRFNPNLIGGILWNEVKNRRETWYQGYCLDLPLDEYNALNIMARRRIKELIIIRLYNEHARVELKIHNENKLVEEGDKLYDKLPDDP